MCGIAGFWTPSRLDRRAAIESMISVMRNRGPDSEGIWQEGEIVFGHRRLAILDLSPLGHQPMFSASGRFVITFNGEIYNFLDLRRDLENRGHSFCGGSDTEVILAALEEWGLAKTLTALVGMFAFAVWDRRERCLFLARDRLGEKPLYFGWTGQSFVFASELKAIRKHPDFGAGINRDSIALFMRHNYVPAPHSIYEGVFKLLPGCWLELTQSRLQSGGAEFSPTPEDTDSSLRPTRYWSASHVCSAGIKSPFIGSEAEALQVLEDKLMLTIKGQMIADVPLGAFLSGGIDSSAIVAFMQRQSTQPVRTFSIGFHETKYNEADYAARVAKHLGTAHTELYVTPGEMQEVVPLLAQLYDEPFSDSSQIPTYLVSKIARRGVTVSLSGDGGDELFGGYSRYLWGERVWRYLESLPGTARGIIATLIKAIGEKRWDWIYDNFKPLLPRSLSFQKFGYKILRLAMVLGQPQRENLYRELVTHWDDASGLVLGSKPALSAMTDPRSWPADLSFIESMMFLDLVSYLPDDILVKVDRASMGVSLESRAPFLDHRLVEFIWSLPMPWKFHKRGSKHLLRQLLYRYVPAALIERPKMGFGVPIDSWLRGPLKEWAEDLLDQERIKQSGYLDAGVVAEKWAEHSSGRRDWGYHLWDVLMFQNWLSEYQH